MLIVKTLFDVIVNCFSNSVEQIPTKFKQVSGEVKFHWSERRGGAEAGGRRRVASSGQEQRVLCFSGFALLLHSTVLHRKTYRH